MLLFFLIQDRSTVYMHLFYSKRRKKKFVATETQHTHTQFNRS